jgi:hypothetical protein
MVELVYLDRVHGCDHSTWQIEGRPWATIERMYRYTAMQLAKNNSRWNPVDIAGLDAVVPVVVAPADFHPTSQLALCNNPDPTCLCYSEDSELVIKSVEHHQTIQWDSKQATIMRKEGVVAF